MSSIGDAMKAHAAAAFAAIPPPEVLQARHAERCRREDRNCLSWWLPRLVGAGLPVPKTETVYTEYQLLDAWELASKRQPPAPEFDKLIAGLGDAADRLGYPAFLRTGQGSGKHHWDTTCFLPSRDAIAARVMALVEWSETVDWIGLPTHLWAVREMLPTTPIGVCPNYGNMPVCREFRFFVRDAELLCWHPYWPLHSLNDGGLAADATEGWYERFTSLTADELGELAALARRAGEALGGYWSVDLLDTKRGWHVTDCAIGERSWHWPECPRAAQ